MPTALDDLHRLIGIAADLADFIQGGSGNDELTGCLRHVELGGLPAERQAVAIHGHYGEHPLAIPFEQLAGVDGTAVVGGDGKDGLGDHGM